MPMPDLPRRMCCVPGCTEFAVRGRGRCEAHLRQPLTDYRAQTNALYRTGRWRDMRARQLAREPLCRICAQEGRLTPATEVDHIRPHRGDRTWFFDPRNLQSLCHRCHSAKTVREDGGFGRRGR